MTVHLVDNGPNAAARVAAAQVSRLLSQPALTSKVSTALDNASVAWVVHKLMHPHEVDGPIKGLSFFSVAGQIYEVECFGASEKVDPKLDLELPTGRFVKSSIYANGIVTFQAIVEIGEKGGEVVLSAIGGCLVPCQFFMRATAL